MAENRAVARAASYRGRRARTMSAYRRLRPLCPRCSSRVRRMHRRWWERGLAWLGLPSRRYACRDVECNWSGRRVRRPRPVPLPAASTTATQAAPVAPSPRWRSVAAVLIGMGVAVLAMAPWQRPKLQPEVVAVGPHKVLRGASYDGDALPADHPLVVPPLSQPASAQPASAQPVPASAPLTLRRHCAWGIPGRLPYQGTVEEALQSARLPAEVISAIAEQVKAGRPDDRLTITTVSIRGDKTGLEFSPRAFALTFGRTLCVGARVNFQRDHFERASLYQAADYRGKVHNVMIPDVCGNVSVLGSEDQLAARAPSESTLGDEQQADRPGGAASGSGGGANANVVSEPPSWAAAGLALLLAGVATWRRGQRQRKP